MKPIRYKIEDTVLDSRINDEWEKYCEYQPELA